LIFVTIRELIGTALRMRLQIAGIQWGIIPGLFRDSLRRTRPFGTPMFRFRGMAPDGKAPKSQ
jgi:hypothetical protein